MMRRLKWLFWTVCLLVVVAVVGSILVYVTIPMGNTQRNRFDAIIVLGYPANPDGTPSPIERARVMEGVEEYRRGVAPALIMTGGAAHNNHVEADVMADFAIAQGVPAPALIREGKAHDTIQNAYYSVQIMQARGWKSAEVVSSPSHIRRASLIFSHFAVEYRVHAAANPPEMGWLYGVGAYVYEIRNTNRIRLLKIDQRRYAHN